MSIEFGWCSKSEDASLLARLGYDFIELPLNTFQLENKAAYVAQMEKALAAELPVKAFNLFFPQELRIVGPAVDSTRVRKYIEAAVRTLVVLKSRILVLGSAGARNVPEGWDVNRAEEQMLRTLEWCADELQGSGITLAIEPLNRGESNLINTVSEGVDYARKLNRKEIRVLADFYHMVEEDEPLETLIDNKEWLAHIHLADTHRFYPGSGTYDYARFFGLLKQIGYKGMISVECITQQKAEDMRKAKQFIDHQWSRA